MVWRFRKSFSPLPGVRLTLSPSGISTSVGVGPLRLTAGPRGPAFAANIPGTGLSFRQSLAGGIPPATVPATNSPLPAVRPPSPSAPLQPLEDVKSAGSGALTTPGLTEFKRLLEQSRREHREISRELVDARARELTDVAQYTDWKEGWLFRRVFKQKFQRLAAAAEEGSARRAELEEQESLSRLRTQIEMPQAVAQAFHRACDEFSLLGRAARIWDTLGQRSANRVLERTTASRIVSREPVAFRLARCEIIESEWNVPHLANANGGDIYLYPGFVLYFVSPEAFALLEYKDVQLMSSPTRFIEEEPLPSDSKVVGETWTKTNKDGTPDRRFKDNYQIPIAQYGKLSLISATGMNEEYMISNAERTESFAKAWGELVNAVAAGV